MTARDQKTAKDALISLGVRLMNLEAARDDLSKEITATRREIRKLERIFKKLTANKPNK